MAKTAKIYAVAKGRVPGIYYSWEKCKEQVDGFPGAEYESFKEAYAAENYLKRKKTFDAPKPVTVTVTKIYAVRNGRIPGIYGSWEDCEKQIMRFPGADYKSFKNCAEAAVYMGYPV